MQSRFKHIAEDLRREIEDSLFGVGLLCRVFARGKDDPSLNNKLEKNSTKYSLNGKLIQDSIGIRIALYFSEDIPLVKSILESKYCIDLPSSTIDKPDRDQFSVTRYNLIFRLPEDREPSFKRMIDGQPLDACFEIQLRSILSEGWHEVEHDLRYKAKDNWKDHDDLSRMLNGVSATLETSEWSMGRIFDELSYRHYKKKNWSGMLPNLLKIRVRGQVPENLAQALNLNPQAAKELLRVDRSKLIKLLHTARPKVPLTMENIIYFWNATGPQHNALSNLTPPLIIDSAKSVCK